MKIPVIDQIPEELPQAQLVQQWTEAFGIGQLAFLKPQNDKNAAKFQVKRKQIQICMNGFWSQSLNNAAEQQEFGNGRLVVEDDKRHCQEMNALAEETQGLQLPKFDDLFEADESPLMHDLDPLEWKKQDHYAVLGLGRMRYLASEDDLKRAYRLKVLKHHPDKHNQGNNSSGGTDEKLEQGKDNYFKCIQKAYEWLTEPVKRRQFDSVDPQFDDSVPNPSQPMSADQFFVVFGDAFKRNAHFSKKHPVPQLGDMETPRASVERFYQFWSSFESWRSFELLDEEQAGDIDNRDERRWMEKKNKAQRLKHKKDDTARLVQLIDNAIRCDPRMQQFREDDANAKKAKKMERGREAREAKEAAEAAAQAAKFKEEQAAAELVRQQTEAKQAKEVKKKEVKSMRRSIRSSCTDKYELFAELHPDVDVSVAMESIISDFADNLEGLTTFATKLDTAADAQTAWAAFVAEYSRVNKAFKADGEAERVKRLAEQKSARAATPAVERPWSNAEQLILVKAVNLFPGGTLNRWETVSQYVAKHAECEPRQPEEVIKMVNAIKKGTVMPNAAAAASESSKTTTATTSPTNENVSRRDWTAAEQVQLESALKQFPASGPRAYKGSDRWDRIAKLVPSRTKDEVIARVKEVVKKMKAKKK